MSTEEPLRTLGWVMKQMSVHGGIFGAGGNVGNAGNASVRMGNYCHITPSNTAPEAIRPDNISRINLNTGEIWAPHGFRPSSEWPFHVAIMREYPEVTAVLHGHILNCQEFAVRRLDIPTNFTYELGGLHVRCTSTFDLPGSQDLAYAVVRALFREGDTCAPACLIANHGVVVVSTKNTTPLHDALTTLGLIERCAGIEKPFILDKPPIPLTEQQLGEVRALMGVYKGS